MRPGTEMFLNADGKLTETGQIRVVCGRPSVRPSVPSIHSSNNGFAAKRRCLQQSAQSYRLMSTVAVLQAPALSSKCG